MADAQPKGPYRLVTVNTAPERAKRLIGRMVEALKDRYTIVHVDNCESKLAPKVHCFDNALYANIHPAIEEVEPKVTEHRPDVLVRHIL